ncbi:Rpn family recombination-promoting nuclease/putative transposase [Cytobacillus massiliigabonensis]|uniref:Rpn family recombination-promoting nuclease/putative transposase n=1 Tax=Cytobacillus massiliigabonensis TaxID=1871011 RepID=UPI000C844625|nr:Rpn family recombination-promoting nuclease/putative transposase [Cytobacillus massiliigabonensis]
MTKEYLDLKMDFMFKQLFGDPRRENITITFLNDLLHRKGNDRIVDVHYENTERIKEDPDGKTSRLDILVFTSTGERINVEIQLANQHDMAERVLFYWSKLFSSSLAAGENYRQLPPTIMISILNYPLFPYETDSFHNVFHLREDTEHFLWCPHIEFHAFDLSQFMVKWRKYRREMKTNPPPELPWLMMLTATDYEKKTGDAEIFHDLEELAMNEQEVREALVEWESLSANKENKMLYEAKLKYLRDQLSNIRGERRLGREEGIEEGYKKGIQVGVEKGIKKGIKEGMASIVRKMEESGLSISDIVSMTGLKEEEVKEMLINT